MPEPIPPRNPRPERTRPSLLREFWYFLREHKKWWLLPILLVVALIFLLVFISGSSVAPFIYTVF